MPRKKFCYCMWQKKIFINASFHDDLSSSMKHALSNLKQTLKLIAIALTCDGLWIKMYQSSDWGQWALSRKRLKLFKRCTAHCVHYTEMSTDPDDYSGKVRLQLPMEMSIFNIKNTFTFNPLKNGSIEKAKNVGHLRDVSTFPTEYRYRKPNQVQSQHIQSFMRFFYF